MLLKNSLGKDNDIIKVRKSKGKSVEKKNKRSFLNVFDIAKNYLDDTNIKPKNSYYFSLNSSDKSNEKDDTTSKDSKELKTINSVNEESFLIIQQSSFEILGNSQKTFKNLKIEENISEKIIKKKKYNKVEKKNKIFALSKTR